MTLKSKIFVAVGLMAVAFAANAEPAKTPDEIAAQLSKTQAAAGPAIDRFTQPSLAHTKFVPIGMEHVMVEVRPSKGYLLTLDGRCEGLTHAKGIAVEGGASSRTVYVKTSHLTVLGPDNPGGMRCKITQIQPLDMSKLRAPAVATN